MADALIDVVSVEELPTVVDLYNQIFRPTRPLESFQRRYLGRHNILQMVARVDDKPVGFFLGFELKPDTFFAWFYGVMPDYRRMSIGSQLMEAAQSWAAQNGYESIRLECHNLHRPMMHLAIDLGYDVVGIRWDADRAANLVIFEKTLTPVES
jgi:ribosomal protein S18 acetylase RimI-like enzyme